jgi:hypothetical protein
VAVGVGSMLVLAVKGLRVVSGFAGRLHAIESKIQPARTLSQSRPVLQPERAVDDAGGVIMRSFLD